MRSKNRRIKAVIAAIAISIAAHTPITAFSQITAADSESKIEQSQNLNWITPHDLTVNDAVLSKGASLSENHEGTDILAARLSEGSAISWAFEIENPGYCEISVTYISTDTKGGDLEISLLSDGEIPSDEFAGIQLKRLYSQDNTFKQNVDGDDISPSATEIHKWQTKRLNSASASDAPLRLEFSAGTHILELQSLRGEIAISEIKLLPDENVPDYKTYSAQNPKEKASSVISIEAEHFAYKNDTTILPSVDTSSPDTSPVAFPNRKLNTVGGSGWKQPGSTVIWEKEISESGLYAIDIRFKQSFSGGIYTSRRLLIDEKLPFAEANAIRFNNGDNWQTMRLGDDENGSYLVYLDKGMHSIALEAVMGDVSELASRVRSSLASLNSVYRKIAMITGVSPDIYRNYRFENLIPDEINEMKQIYRQLDEVVKDVKIQAGVGGGYTAVIEKLLFQLNEMSSNPDTIAKNLEKFKSNLGALGTWMLTSREQPLQIDIIQLTPADEQINSDKTGFLGGLFFRIKQFISSFFKKNTGIGMSSGVKYDKKITVYMQSGGFPPTGRDNAEILRKLIDSSFSPDNNAEVNLQIVAADTVIQSVLAGRGPDITLNMPSTEPINYAIRGAALDLTEFSDFENVSSRFFPAAVDPFRFNGRVYALPEYFTFPMFFYRTDVFKELGFEIPKNWDELLLLIPELQGKGLSMAMPQALAGYAYVLYQNSGELYRDGGVETNLDSELSLSSFKEFSELFTLHDLPVQYDFSNRFRTGEMPCGIADITLYNQLSVFAPEIRGHWEMAPVPGKLRPDGTVSHAAAGTSGGSMIMPAAKDKQTSWAFIKWWLSDSTQSQYARDLESVQGAAAKYMTANRAAVSQISWTQKEYTNILAQAEQTLAIPEVPGSYYLPRVISFAFNRSYNGSATTKMAEDPLEVMRDYMSEFNDEIARKRAEFGIK